MLEKLRRQGASSSSSGTIFDKDVFLRPFFPSLTRIYDGNPDLRESTENQFRPFAFQYYVEDVNTTARKAYSDQQDAEIDESRARHQLAKKPRFNPENLATESPGDSPSPGEYSGEGVYLADHFASFKPKEWEKSLYGIDNDSQRRRQLKPKPKKN